MYAGYNEIPLFNKFEILSDKDQMCTSGDINTYPDPLGDQNYTNNSNYFDYAKTNVKFYKSPQIKLYNDLND